jgi:hypothetical protein
MWVNLPFRYRQPMIRLEPPPLHSLRRSHWDRSARLKDGLLVTAVTQRLHQFREIRVRAASDRPEAEGDMSDSHR